MHYAFTISFDHFRLSTAARGSVVLSQTCSRKFVGAAAISRYQTQVFACGALDTAYCRTKGQVNYLGISPRHSPQL